MERQHQSKSGDGQQYGEGTHARHSASARDGAHPLRQLQQSVGNQAVGRFLQTKLRLSHPSDPAEREADAVAHHVINTPDPPSQAASQHQQPAPFLSAAAPSANATLH
ncbi:MAG: hypothetical protein WCD76_21405, partial [Pyrinomonadaceae bacterium]